MGRRAATQLEVLSMVLNTWHRSSPATHFGSSITGTAWFLWVLLLLALVLGLAWVVVALVERSEEDCKHHPGPFGQVECTQRGELQRAGKVDDVRHAATVPVEAQPEYVHEAVP